MINNQENWMIISWKKYSSYHFDNHIYLRMRKSFLNDFLYYKKLILNKMNNWLWKHEKD